MGKLYLKEINKNDLYLLEKYNEDILSHQLKPSITSDSFVDWLQKMETSRSDSTKVHFFPYFLMLDDIPIGMPIIKTNIEVDEFWLKYGGNISYVISPSYRKKGYGNDFAMFNEYTVRALTIRIISIMFGKDYEKDLIEEEVNTGFAYIDDLVKLLKVYEEHRNKYSTIDDFMRNINNFFINNLSN